MKTLTRILIFGLLTIVTGAVAAEVVIKQRPMTLDDVAGKNGQELYGQLCAVCHGATGKGDGPATPALNRPLPDLTRFEMSARGDLTHEQIEDVIAGRSRLAHVGIVGMPQWEREFQYVRRDWSGTKHTAYARARIHELAEYVDELKLAQIAMD